ncbi:MAG: fructosamine kinase family protein [Actinomycetota bacterium]
MIDQGVVADLTGRDVVDLTPLRGGDVAESFRVTLSDGSIVFAKTHRNPPPGFFTTEAWGLRWLRDAGSLPVPEVLGVSDEPPLLILEWIDEGGRGGSDEAAFGRALAELHRAGAPCFGREDRRTTGSRGLPNEPTATWAEFYKTQRLEPLARLAADAQALSPSVVSRLEAVATRLDALGGPPEPPARLHGDLWAGNRLIDRQSRSWLIDPACHGGHREFDLAMMQLFGGFGPAAYAAYDEAFPLADGWPDRVPLHQLAPLVVHAIKFGGGYAGAVDQALHSLGA